MTADPSALSVRETHMYYAAACQTAFDCPTERSEIAARTERMCEIVENTIVVNGFHQTTVEDLAASKKRPRSM